MVSLLDLKYYGEKSAFGNKTFPRKTDKLENALLAIKQASQLKKKCVGHVYSRQSFPLCLILFIAFIVLSDMGKENAN